MKTYFSFFLLIFLCLAARAQTSTTNFTLTGHTWQKDGLAQLLLYSDRNEFVPYDSTGMKDGSFSFHGTLDEPKIFLLQAGRRSRIVFIGNETATVKEKDSIRGEMVVSGSPLTDDYDVYFNKWIAPLMSRSEMITKALETTDATQKQKRDSLTAVQSALFAGVPDSTVTFIRQHPHSFVSLHLLNYYQNSYNVILLNSLYSLLDKNLKQYPSAIALKGKIEMRLHESTPCPSFSASDINHQTITLQSFQGSYLLIDFWASWCVPCIENLPYLQKAAVQFQHDNLKILTASLDKDTTAWKTALLKYHLTDVCRNVFLPGQFRNPMSLQFNLSYLPQNVLVNPQGIIIARNIEGKELIERLQRLLRPVTADGNDVAMDNIRTTSHEPE